MSQREDELFDLGYQRYDGPREGRMQARKAVFAAYVGWTCRTPRQTGHGISGR